MTLTVYTPADPAQDRFDMAETPRLTLVGDRVQDSPVEGRVATVRSTTPENPFTGVRLILVEPGVAAFTVKAVGPATVKSCTVKVAEAV